MLTEETLILAIKQGNERAFEQTFRQHYAPLCRYANSMLKDPDEAEDIVQRMFVGFWEKREEIEIEQSLKSYFYKSVHNHCLNRIKHLKIRELHQEHSLFFDTDSSNDVMETVAANELQTRLTAAIEKLPEQCRLIFKMNRLDGLKYQEVANVLGLSVKTIENQIGKALKVLRVELIEFLSLIMIFFYDAN